MSLWGFSFGMGAMVSTGVHLSAASVVNPLGIVLMVIGTGFLVFLCGRCLLASMLRRRVVCWCARA